MNHDMTWYFAKGIEKKAVLLDGSNLNKDEFPLFSCFVDYLNEILRGSQYIFELGYSYPGGKYIFREMIAKHESNVEQTSIWQNDIVISGMGVTGLILFIAQIIYDEYPESKILCPYPTYPGVVLGLEHGGLKVVPITTLKRNKYSVEFDEIRNNYSPNVSSIFITNPGNPICTYIDETELLKIFDFAINRNCYLIVDAIFEESPHFVLKKCSYFKNMHDYGKLIKIKGYSKDLPQFNDFRLGWSICKNMLINEKILEKCEVVNYSNSSMLDLLGAKAMHYRVLQDKNLNEDNIERYNLEVTNYHHKILSTINDSLLYISKADVFEPPIRPDAGNVIFLCLSVKARKKHQIQNSHDLAMHVLDKTNILVSPGHIFGMPFEEPCFRITVSQNNAFFLNKLREIIACFE